MNKKLKGLLACFMCVCSAGGVLTGCGDGFGSTNYGEVELPYYSYENTAIDGDYNSNLFYRNDYDTRYGDPSMIYIDEGEYAGTFVTTGTSTGTGFSVSTSTDFINWEIYPSAFVPAKNNYGDESFWAPQLMYDKTARWGDYNMGTAEEADNTGLFILYYAAKTAGTEKVLAASTHYLGVAIATAPTGPYKEYTGTNQNGTVMNASVPLFDIEYINPDNPNALCTTLDNNATTGWEYYRQGRSFIDASMFLDPVTGDKYMYFCRSRAVDSTNEIWGVKMKDWVTPDYSTVTRITAFEYLTVDAAINNDKTRMYDVKGYTLKIDEGPFVYYNDGTYYMTFSIGSTNDKLYPVGQATSTSPLGTFTKVQGADGGLVVVPGTDWDMNSAGHHSFLTIGDELWIVYHGYPISKDGTLGSRAQAVDRVFIHENNNGQKVLHANGPTKNIQALPEVVSGYKNVAPLATVTATNVASESSAAYLNDNLISMHGDFDVEYLNDQVAEFEVNGKETVITLDFGKDTYVTARAIMIYNSHEYKKAFESIEKIEFAFRDKDGKTGVAVIKNLGFNKDANVVPLDYIYSEEELAELGDLDEYYTIRTGGAAIAEFNEISVNKIRLTIKKGGNKDSLNINEIVVLGKTE